MFDPYYKWLSIPPNEQPPHHYRLLGLQLFERDVEVIEAAANRQMAYVQQRASGGQAAVSQRLLNELSAARVCLLDPKKKAAYDADLKAKTGVPPATEAKTAERLPEKRQALPAAEPWEADGSVSHSLAEPGESEGLLSERLWSEVSSGSHRSTAGIPHRPRRRSNHGNWKYLGIGGGLVAFVLIAVLISQNLSTGPDTKEEAAAQGRNSSPRTTREPANVPTPSTPPQEPATHSHVASTAPSTDEPPPAAKDTAIEAADRVSLWNNNEVWVMDNKATAIEYSFDQEQWTPVANLVKTVAACSGKIDDARIGDLTATVYVRYTDSSGKLSPVYKIPVASVEAHNPPKELTRTVNPPRSSPRTESPQPARPAPGVAADAGSTSPASTSTGTALVQLSILRGHTGGVQHLAFSPDGSLAASGADDKTVRVWNLQDTQASWTASDFARRIIGLRFSPNGEKLFAADRSDVWVIDVGTHERTRICPLPVADRPGGDAAVVFNNACTLFVAHDGGAVVLYDIRRHQVVGRLNEFITCFAFFAHDQGIVGDMRLLNCRTGQVRPMTVQPQAACCESVALSPDGNYVVYGTGRCFRAGGPPPDANLVRIWDLRNGQLVRDLHDHRQWVRAVAFVPDGKRILSGGGGCNEDFGGFRPDADHAIRLWDAKTGTLLETADAHRTAVFSLAVSKDGSHILSASADGTVILWKLERVTTLQGHGTGSTNSTPSNREKPPTKGLIQIRIFREGNWISHEVTHEKGQAYVTRFDGVKVPLQRKGDILSFTTQFGTIFTINTKTRKSVLNEPVELVYE